MERSRRILVYCRTLVPRRSAPWRVVRSQSDAEYDLARYGSSAEAVDQRVIRVRRLQCGIKHFRDMSFVFLGSIGFQRKSLRRRLNVAQKEFSINLGSERKGCTKNVTNVMRVVTHLMFDCVVHPTHEHERKHTSLQTGDLDQKCELTDRRSRQGHYPSPT